jgi:3-keto steroid reductase
VVFISFFYFQCRALEAKLAASRTGPGRVLWMSSHQASGDAHDPEDWQVVQNPKPYEATKFQIDLIRAELSRRVGPSASIRYFTVDPGVVDSSMHTALDAGIKFYIKMITFYIVRPFVSFYLRHEYVRLAEMALFVFTGPVIWLFGT